MKLEKSQLINVFVNIYAIFTFFSNNIILCLILNHFNFLNTFTGALILIFNIFGCAFLGNYSELWFTNINKNK